MTFHLFSLNIFSLYLHMLIFSLKNLISLCPRNGVHNIPGKGANIVYEVTAEKQSDSTLSDTYVKLYLERSTDNSSFVPVNEASYYVGLEESDAFGAGRGEMVLDTNTMTHSMTYYYRLRMWVDVNYEASSESKSFTVKVNVYGSDTAINSKNYDVAIKTDHVTSNVANIKIGYNGTGNASITP